MSARNLLLFASDAGLALASVGTFTEVGATNFNTRRRLWSGAIQSYVRLQASFREAVTTLTFQIEYTEAFGQTPFTTLVTFEPITEATVSLNLATEWIFIPEEFQQFEGWSLVMRVMYHNNSTGALTMTYLALDLR